MAAPDPEHLQLTDFLDLPTLQEIQDSFAAVAQVKAVITDAAGKVLTQAKPTKEFLRRQLALAGSGDLQSATGWFVEISDHVVCEITDVSAEEVDFDGEVVGPTGSVHEDM